MIEKIQRIKAEIEALKVSKSEDLENIRIKSVSYTHLTLPTTERV